MSSDFIPSKALRCGVADPVDSLVSLPSHPTASSSTPIWVWASTRPGIMWTPWRRWRRSPAVPRPRQLSLQRRSYRRPL